MGGLDYLRLDKTKTKHYRFDFALGPTSTQTEVYEKTNKPLVHKALEGYNACCFAYGATGAGKTFTMMGNLEHAGVIPLTLIDLFDLISADEEHDVRLSMQYVEIYNEKIKDLLNPSDANLDVREVPSRGTYVAGATDKTVSTPDEMMALIHEGNLYRTTEATKVNEVSSRSHAVLQVTVRARNKYAEDAQSRLGKLSMIDLAGSERANKTDNTGARLVEGQNINRSLLALGNCINALADKTKKVAHVPYRDSKLTRLLKDSLGGNCLTTMIANVSPSHDQFDETLNSLKYANRAKNIKPRGGLPIIINEEQREAPKQLLQKLQRELASMPQHEGDGMRDPRLRAAGERAPGGGSQPAAPSQIPTVSAHAPTHTTKAGGGRGVKAGGRSSNLPKPSGGAPARRGGRESAAGGGEGRGPAAPAGGGGSSDPNSVHSPYGIPMPPPLDLDAEHFDHFDAAALWPLAMPSPSGEGGERVWDPTIDGEQGGYGGFGGDHAAEGIAGIERVPSFSRGMRSPGLGHRNWGQISGGVSQVSAAVTQPRALQMYQLLDNMEVEESQAIAQEASALLDEHTGLLEDLYKTMQDALLLRLRTNAEENSGVEDRPREGDARGDREELAELDEEKEALQGQLGANTSRIFTLIQELPTRIISIERLQILRLTLQNIALHIQRKERELQMSTVRRVLLRDDDKDAGAERPSPQLAVALHAVEALIGGPVASSSSSGGGGGGSDGARLLREATVRELLDTCSTSYGGGDELLELAGGDHKLRSAKSPEERAQGMMAQAAATTRRSAGKSPHLSLAAVVPTLIEVQDSEDRHRRGESPVGESRARSPSLLSRQKSIGEFVREAAAFSTARDSARDSESSTTRHRMDPTSEPPPGTPLMRAAAQAKRNRELLYAPAAAGALGDGGGGGDGAPAASEGEDAASHASTPTPPETVHRDGVPSAVASSAASQNASMSASTVASAAQSNIQSDDEGEVTPTTLATQPPAASKSRPAKGGRKSPHASKIASPRSKLSSPKGTACTSAWASAPPAEGGTTSGATSTVTSVTSVDVSDPESAWGVMEAGEAAAWDALVLQQAEAAEPSPADLTFHIHGQTLHGQTLPPPSAQPPSAAPTHHRSASDGGPRVSYDAPASAPGTAAVAWAPATADSSSGADAGEGSARRPKGKRTVAGAGSERKGSARSKKEGGEGRRAASKASKAAAAGADDDGGGDHSSSSVPLRRTSVGKKKEAPGQASLSTAAAPAAH